MVLAGAFDCFSDIDRAQYLQKTDGADSSFIEKILKYCAKKKIKESSAQVSLFGEEESTQDIGITYPECEPMSLLDKLKNEKEMIGFYISGHPLDIYSDEIKSFANSSVAELEDINVLYENNRNNLSFSGIITEAGSGLNKKNQQYGYFTLEDKKGAYRFFLSGKDFLKYQAYLKSNIYVWRRRFHNRQNGIQN